MSCNYLSSGLIDKGHWHIVTENLGMVWNKKLRKLFTKGSRYKKTNNISWGIVHKTNNQAISDHTKILRNKFNLEVDEKNKNFLAFTELLNFINTRSKTKFIITAPQFLELLLLYWGLYINKKKFII